ncbi:MAG: ATP-binding cassette domain-containing protein [Gammaproteobacteria bacterium]|nr:ATP-binding cassette domain-containing protein [Gammaproteobacteria bacterium]
MSVIAARELKKNFGRNAVVKGIDFAVAPGSCFGLLGPNGAGKTTTLKMTLGLSPPTGGELKVFDLPMPGSASLARRRIGVVPQLDNLDPDFTVAENLLVYASFFGIPVHEVQPRLDALLDFVNLRDKADSRIHTLSGGMQRRLTIARALVNDPELIVLDEPTTGLDPQARHLIWRKLRDLVAMGKTLLLTTHYMEEAERLCDELAIMENGLIIAQGSPSALIGRHVLPEVVEVRSEYETVQNLLPEYPDVEAELIGDTLYVYGREVKALLARVDEYASVNYVHRPANLEDVFLKLTGRELRD